MTTNADDSDNINVGCLVYLRDHAKGYPMLPDPIQELGAGIVLNSSRAEIEKCAMVLVLWSKTNTQRWEFLDDLIVVEHT